jgi:branched-chain amino acid aminotransferase
MPTETQSLKVWLNGMFQPAEEARVSIFDRSFLYGDGLFETVRVYGNRPFLWAEHLARLHAGSALLRLRLAYGDAELSAAAAELLTRNAMPESLLRLHVSRGVGRRGYSPRGADSPTVILSQHPTTPNAPAAPVTWKLATGSLRLPAHDPLTAVKSASKLLHVLARAEAEDLGADEALLLNSAGDVAEATSGNVFWLADGRLFTPPLTDGALAGVTRAWVLRLAAELGLPAAEQSGTPDDLRAAEGVFLTLSSLEIVLVSYLDGMALRQSPVTRRLHEAYQASVRQSA